MADRTSAAIPLNFKMLNGNSAFFNNEAFTASAQRQKSRFCEQGNRDVNGLEFTYGGICAPTLGGKQREER